MEFKTIKTLIVKLLTTIFIVAGLTLHLNAQNEMSTNNQLTAKQQSIITIAALTAKGDLQALKPALNAGLEAGLTVNQIKEVLVHLYAYCGFPRSIRGLQTFMEVLDERKARGIKDETGREASPIYEETSKYERGKKVLGELTKTKQEKPTSGYGAFAPIIDTFLKEHLFADIFERDVLTFAERELVTISVISAIGNAEPMLKSHLAICLNVGLTPAQLTEFSEIIGKTLGEKEAGDAQIVVNDVLKNSSTFPKGEKISNSNFTGTVWLKNLVEADSINQNSVACVTFEPGARSNWHKHPSGQILLAISGIGYYQEKGAPLIILQKGDAVKCPPNIPHWHGAGPDQEFVQVAITSRQGGPTEWLQVVTDEEYGQSAK